MLGILFACNTQKPLNPTTDCCQVSTEETDTENATTDSQTSDSGTTVDLETVYINGFTGNNQWGGTTDLVATGDLVCVDCDFKFTMTGTVSGGWPYTHPFETWASDVNLEMFEATNLAMRVSGIEHWIDAPVGHAAEWYLVLDTCEYRRYGYDCVWQLGTARHALYTDNARVTATGATFDIYGYGKVLFQNDGYGWYDYYQSYTNHVTLMWTFP